MVGRTVICVPVGLFGVLKTMSALSLVSHIVSFLWPNSRLASSLAKVSVLIRTPARRLSTM